MTVIYVVVLVMSVSMHEAAHGWMAYRYGDPTAKELGRITLNPLKHIDPFLSIFLPAILYFTTGFIFGGAKPVPFNPYRMRPGTDLKKAIMWVAAAGPISNFIAAVTGLFLAQLLVRLTGQDSYVFQFLYAMYWVNLILGSFNLLPIPPLDGGKVLAGLLPDQLALQLYRMERYGMLVIIILIMTPLSKLMFLPIGLLDYFLTHAIHFIIP